MLYNPLPGTNGLFTFAAPFENLINTSEPVTVVANRSFSNLVGLDLFKFIYEPVGLTKEDMYQDISDGITIITIQRSNGDSLNLPSSYIVDAPPMDGVVYKNYLMAINLGLLPEEYDFDTIKTDIIEYIKDRIGIKPAVTLAPNGAPKHVGPDIDAQLTTLRNSGQYVTKSLLTLNRELQRLLDETNAKLALLEKHYTDNNLGTEV